MILTPCFIENTRSRLCRDPLGNPWVPSVAAAALESLDELGIANRELETPMENPVEKP